MRVAPLTTRDRADLDALLHADLEVNLFLIGVLHSTASLADGAWWGVRDNGVLAGVCFVARGTATGGALAVPFGVAEACRQLGRTLSAFGPPAMVIGPREECDALWQGLGDPASRIHYDQRLYVCREGTDGPGLSLRKAVAEDLDLVLAMSGEMMEEDLGEDPREIDPVGYRRVVGDRIRAGRSWLGHLDETPCFKVDVGTDTTLGAQVGGTWVPTSLRGQRVAQRGMRALAQRMLAQRPMVTLHVNEENLAAVRCYERVGFVAAAPFRLISR